MYRSPPQETRSLYERLVARSSEKKVRSSRKTKNVQRRDGIIVRHCVPKSAHHCVGATDNDVAVGHSLPTNFRVGAAARSLGIDHQC